MGFEIAEQLAWRMPDAILYPTGGGVGLIGVFLAFQQLLELGWVEGRMPRLIAVQPEGCQPIVRAFHAGAEASEFHKDARTLQQGTRVPKALACTLAEPRNRRRMRAAAPYVTLLNPPNTAKPSATPTLHAHNRATSWCCARCAQRAAPRGP